MVVKYLRGKEIRKTRKLYEDVFQDSKEYTDYFYHHAEQNMVAIAAMEDEEIIGELFLVPKLLSVSDRYVEALYVYGVATAEKYRGRGIMKRLLQEAEDYAATEEADCLYLIPVDEKIYESSGYVTIKQGENHIWELSPKEATEMLKFNLETIQPEEPDKELYREISVLESEIRQEEELAPLWDKEYLTDRILRASVDGGGVYLLRKRNDYSIAGLIVTGEEDGEIVILDILGASDRKEGLVKDFMRWKGTLTMKEYIFPVMVKIVNPDFSFPENMKVVLNDEI
ncbi:MAG: GNAT family N-acetyltransferase [Lachnospiraceae bacterium]|nr:GNAT family N-acetyltransferase [Lachnospiraceae bacterium]